mmetsp:Transcript_8621/g.15621  ORF Transcript_8621/g.15621 Transcript_8621/m.15621 type:complete len:113 (-) Transcript_8621:68-406(-)
MPAAFLATRRRRRRTRMEKTWDMSPQRRKMFMDMVLCFCLVNYVYMLDGMGSVWRMTMLEVCDEIERLVGNTFHAFLFLFVCDVDNRRRARSQTNRMKKVQYLFVIPTRALI